MLISGTNLIELMSFLKLNTNVTMQYIYILKDYGTLSVRIQAVSWT